MPASARSGISVSPNAWNFSGDSQTSVTRSPSGVAPAACERQPPPGQSASAHRLPVVDPAADLLVLLDGRAREIEDHSDSHLAPPPQHYPCVIMTVRPG